MSYEPIPYPRMLYRLDGTLVVHSEQEEAAARKDGYGNPLDEDREIKPAAKAAPASDGSVDLEAMKAGELIQYAKDKGLEIGDLKPQSGKEKILAAVLAAQAGKE